MQKWQMKCFKKKKTEFDLNEFRTKTLIWICHIKICLFAKSQTIMLSKKKDLVLIWAMQKYV